ncbi:cupin domain-containing protein [Escherichia coli]|nr:cupin domain-containing protein [Escherichia coli]
MENLARFLSTTLKQLRQQRGWSLSRLAEATPHEKGVIEHVVVIDGQLDLCVDGEWQTLNCGEGVRFAADVTHIYRNGGEQTVHFHSLIHYPRS